MVFPGGRASGRPGPTDGTGPRRKHVMIGALTDRLGRWMPSSPAGAFKAGLLLGAAVGLTVVLFIRPVIMGRERAFGGAGHDGYVELGANIIRGRGYVFAPGGRPVMHRPPVVPVLIAPLTLLPAGVQQPALIILHSLLFGATCMLLYRLAERLFGRRTARASVGCLLFYPWVYWHIKNPMSVVTQMFFSVLLAELLCIELFTDRDSPDDKGPRRRWARTTALAVAAAGAVLTHGAALASVPVLLLLSVSVHLAQRRFQAAGRLLAAGAMAILLVAPWTYRNWCVTGRLVPVASNAGFAYFLGEAHWSTEASSAASAGSTLQRTLDTLEITPADVHYWGISDPAVDAGINARMKAHALSNPARLARKCALNAIEFYLPTAHDVLLPSRSRGGAAFLESIALSLWHAALGVLAVIALCKAGPGPARRRLAGVAVALLVLVLPYLPFLVFVGHSQYALHTIPFLSVLASAGAVSLLGSGPPAGKSIC